MPSCQLVRQRIIFTRDLLETLRRRDLGGAANKIARETGIPFRPSAGGEHVAGIYRQRVTLSSGRFAMIEDGLGFSWRPGVQRWSSSSVVRWPA
jgi:hypothetical protein